MPPVMIALTTYSGTVGRRGTERTRSIRSTILPRRVRSHTGVGHAVVHEQLQHVEVLQLVH